MVESSRMNAKIVIIIKKNYKYLLFVKKLRADQQYGVFNTYICY